MKFHLHVRPLQVMIPHACGVFGVSKRWALELEQFNALPKSHRCAHCYRSRHRKKRMKAEAYNAQLLAEYNAKLRARA